MQIDIQELKALLSKIQEFNAIPFRDIEWVDNGKKFDVSDEQIEEWRFIGLTNVSFIDTGYYLDLNNCSLTMFDAIPQF